MNSTENVMKRTENHSIDFSSLIINYLVGIISKEEMDLLQHWISADEQNKAHFDAIKNAWILSGMNNKSLQQDPENAWEKLHQRMRGKETLQKGIRSGLVMRYMRTAATWLVLFAMGSTLTYLFYRKPSEMMNNPVSVVVPLGAKSNITLPDGSNVWLNAGTTLTYYQDYGQKERKLHLTGEAFFDVAKDKSHPFIVQTSGMLIKALGTRFNVKAYPEEKTISATLEEGKIDISVMKAGKEEKQIILKPNEKVVFFKGIRESETYNENTDEIAVDELESKNIQPSVKKDINVLTNVNTELFTSWKDPRWIIQGEQLGTLATSLERRYNLKIVFEDPDLRKYKFTGTIENETVDQIMDALRMTAPLDYSISKDIITLIPDTDKKEEFGRIITRKNN